MIIEEKEKNTQNKLENYSLNTKNEEEIYKTNNTIYLNFQKIE